MLLNYAYEFIHETIPEYFQAVTGQFRTENLYFVYEFFSTLTPAVVNFVSQNSNYKFQFDDLQIFLVGIFSTVLLVNSVAIYFYWRWYGARVVKKCKKADTRKLIEELKKSVDLLKLPKIHSPRI